METGNSMIVSLNEQILREYLDSQNKKDLELCVKKVIKAANANLE